MKNKLLIFFVLISLAIIANAQLIGLQKNGTERVYHFKLPKFVSFDYQTDSGMTHIEAKAINYDFPILELINKQNTIQIDVRKISKLNYKSRIAGLYYIGAFTTSLFSITIMIMLNH